MSTRRAHPQALLSQDRFMCSAEFAELRGISGRAVAKRCALLVSPAKQQLLWWIQAMSLSRHGLKRLVADLLNTFPERLSTHSMRRFGVTPGKVYKPAEVSEIRRELSPDIFAMIHGTTNGTASKDSISAMEFEAECRRMALEVSDSGTNGSLPRLALEEFLVELCIDPGIYIELDRKSTRLNSSHLG